MRLLLLSNSRNPGGEYLAHALDAFADLLAGRTSAWFVPFAGVTVPWDGYTAMVPTALAPLGVTVTGAHVRPRPGAEDAILVGGGNTFQLLASAVRGLLADRAPAVGAGVPYAGWSAGANLACPTIRTTNDMPIVDPRGFDAFGFLPYQINPHFTNALPAGASGRDARAAAHRVRDRQPGLHVLGLPEGDWVRVRGDALLLAGPKPATWLRAGHAPAPLAPGALPRAFFMVRPG